VPWLAARQLVHGAATGWRHRSPLPCPRMNTDVPAHGNGNDPRTKSWGGRAKERRTPGTQKDKIESRLSTFDKQTLPATGNEPGYPAEVPNDTNESLDLKPPPANSETSRANHLHVRFQRERERAQQNLNPRGAGKSKTKCMYLGERDEVSLAANHGNALGETNQRVAGSWALQRHRLGSQLVRHLQTPAAFTHVGRCWCGVSGGTENPTGMHDFGLVGFFGRQNVKRRRTRGGIALPLRDLVSTEDLQHAIRRMRQEGQEPAGSRFPTESVRRAAGGHLTKGAAYFGGGRC